MAQVPLTINGRNYRVACDDGQEERVHELARVVDDTVQELVSRVGQVGEMQLLVMAAILLADEVEEARASGLHRGGPGGLCQPARSHCRAARAGLSRADALRGAAGCVRPVVPWGQ